MTITPSERILGNENLPADEVPKNVSPMIELGQTGLRRTSGYVDEEFLPQLRGRKAVQVFREMAENDPITGALLYAVDRLLRQVDWRVEPADTTDEQKKAAEFIEQCMEDMSHTWDDMLTEILTMLPYGFSWHELVYKKRVGPWERDPKKRSKYTDNKIGWRKIPIRAQETMLRWVFDDTGGIKAMVQLAPPHYKTVVLPIEKSMLFRVSQAKGNPEGRSFLRNAYRPWFVKKRLEEIMLIGMERDLAGLPMGRVPQDYLSAKKGTEKAQFTDAFRKMVRAVRRNEQEGIIIPRMIDPDTKIDLFDFSLVNSGGGRQIDIKSVIDEYNLQILQSVLADFIKVGHEGTGSYAMHTDKSGLFRASINSIAQTIADAFNRYAIPRLFAINGWKIDQLPQIVPSDVDPPNLAELASFMGQLATAGVSWFPDVELEKFLRQAARLPKLDEQSEKVKEQEERQADVMRLAEQQMGMLNLQIQAEQGRMGLEQQALGTEQQKIQHERDLQYGEDERQMQHAGTQMSLAQQQRQLETPDQDPRLQQQREDEMHQMTLAEKEQAMSQRDEEHQANLKMKTDEHSVNLTTKQKEAAARLKAAEGSAKADIDGKKMTFAQKLKIAEERHRAQQKGKEKK